MPRARRASVALAAMPLLLALSGCSAVAAFTPHVQPAIFDTAKEFRAADTAVLGSAGFVPDDATVIRVDYDSESGEAIMTYTSPTHLAAGACGAEPTAPKPKPTILDSWWPVSGIPEKVYDCKEGWGAFIVNDQVYAARAVSAK